MKASYLTHLMSSFYLWIDHEILSRGEAFINYSGKLYETNDPNFLDSSLYGAPFKQWVYDSSIAGANVPTGIYSNGTFLPKDTSGLALDYNNGRAIFNANTVTGENITASYSLKEFNIYYTDEREEKLLFEKAYEAMPKTYEVTGSLGYLDNPYPCIFIKHRTSENLPFAFGGLDSSQTEIRCIVLSDTSFKLDSAISILNDSSRKVFPLLSADEVPFNYLGDFKTGSYFNYQELCQDRQDLVMIDKVSISKLDALDNDKINKKCVAALVDFNLSAVRLPRAPMPPLPPDGLLSSVLVDGGGWDDTNNLFVYVTQLNNKPQYNYGYQKFIFYANNQWGIYDLNLDPSGPLYASQEDVQYPWLVSFWTAVNSNYAPFPYVIEIP